MKKLIRDARIRLFMVGQNEFEVRNTKDDVLIDSDSNYFIYMQNVNFRSGNIIDGRYLGEMKDDSPLLDSHCKNVITNGETFMVGDNVIRTAKMVAVNNKEKIIVVIDN